MVKEQREKIIAAILISVLLFLTWANFFRDTPKKKTAAEESAQMFDLRNADGMSADSATSVLLGRPDEAALSAQQAVMQQDWGRDPFSSDESGMTSQKGRLLLRGISWTNGKAMAVINDEIVQVGESIDDSIIVSIDRTKVMLKKDGREFYLILEEE